LGAGVPILVTAGNAVIGVAGAQSKLVNGVTTQVIRPVDGLVTRVLTKTGQTLVDIGQGNTLVLGKAGGQVGDLLRIDLGSKTVIGAPSGSPLLGVGVLSATGQNSAALGLGVLNPAGSGNIVTVTGSKPAGVLGGVLQPVTTTVSAVTSPVTGGVIPGGQNSRTTGIGNVVTTTTTTVKGVVGGVTGATGSLLPLGAKK
jgi:hypothetical protein